MKDNYITDIEAIVKNALDNAGIKYKFQHSTRTGYIIDFAIPDKKIAIECDGEMWHTSKKSRRKDRHKDYKLRREGWTVIRLWGYEIKSDVERCINKIKQLI